MRTLQEIFNSLPTIECKGLCSDSCGTFHISPAEMANISKFVNEHNQPWHQFLSRVDAITKALDHTMNHAEGCGCFKCPYLENGKCTIYDARPLICRLWGVSEGLGCSYGCKINGKKLSKKEAHAILDEVEALMA